MKIDLNEIYTIKTSYGEEIVTKISQIVEVDGQTLYNLSKPLAVVFSQQGVQMISAVVTGDPESEVWINKNNCVLISKSRREAADGYLETTTGIKPVSSKILMG